MRSFAFALLAATAFATPALAQDAAPFTGARVEGIVGWDQLRNNGKDDGVLYGVGAGYDVQMGSLLVGGEAEFSDSDVKQRQFDVLATGDSLTARTGRDLYVGARVGGVIGGRTLLYAKAGYTNARAKLAYDDGATGTANFRDHVNLDGVRLGVGAEYAVGSNSFIKAEYRYSNYEQGFSRNQALAGFGFRF
jgi:outer membrane immunogenic protein